MLRSTLSTGVGQAVGARGVWRSHGPLTGGHASCQPRSFPPTQRPQPQKTQPDIEPTPRMLESKIIMPLPPASPHRALKHRRSIELEVFLRDDGLWEMEARLRDIKTRDSPMNHGEIRPAGEPIHDLRLRLVVQTDGLIVASGSESVRVPHPGHCEFQHHDPYQALTGLNLKRNFRRSSLERLVGVRGCTHLTELAQVLPTALIQGQYSERTPQEKAAMAAPDAPRPFQIDRCHALRADGEVVRLYHPRWFRQPDAKKPEHNPADPLQPPSA